MRTIHSLLAAVVAGLSLSSCGGGGAQVEYIPVQEESGGNWGMVGTDGTMLFADEFKNQPTMARNGRFMAKNADGLWEIYTADAKPAKVGKEYLQAGDFVEDVAPVVEKGKCIDFIDRDGEVKFTLDKADGKPVSSVRNFADGLAVFCAGGAYGCIDTSGKVVVKPEYAAIWNIGDGKLFARHIKYADKLDEDSRNVVLDYSGKVLFEYKADKYTAVTPFADGEAIAYQTSEDGSLRYGIIDDKGEWVVKPSSKLHRIEDKQGKNFIFYDGEAYGLMDTDGEVLLRAKFDMLCFLTADRLVKGDKDGCIIIDLEGNEISQEPYERILTCYDGKHMLAKESKDSYIFIDLEGQPVDKKQSFHDYGAESGDEVVESDYVDMGALADKFLQQDGIVGITSATTVPEVFQKGMVEEYNYWLYTTETSVDANLSIEDCEVRFCVGFKEPPVGIADDEYVLKDSIRPLLVVAEIGKCRKLEGRYVEFYKAFCEKIKAQNGKERASADGRTVYDCGNRIIIVTRQEKGVVLGVVYTAGMDEETIERLINQITNG